MIRDIVKISDENGEEILSTKCKNINFKDCMKVAQDLIMNSLSLFMLGMVL